MSTHTHKHTRTYPYTHTCTLAHALSNCPVQNHTASTTLRGFGRSLGRVVSYRALALDDAALTGILKEDCIFPSGQLQVSADTLAGIVDTHGVQAVCVCRLFTVAVFVLFVCL